MKLLAALLLLGPLTAPVPFLALPDSSQCQEDTGCPDGRPWDCHTMGNLICGPGHG